MNLTRRQVQDSIERLESQIRISIAKHGSAEHCKNRIDRLQEMKSLLRNMK